MNRFISICLLIFLSAIITYVFITNKNLTQAVADNPIPIVEMPPAVVDNSAPIFEMPPVEAEIPQPPSEAALEEQIVMSAPESEIITVNDGDMPSPNSEIVTTDKIELASPESSNPVTYVTISQVTREFLETIEDSSHAYYLYLVFNGNSSVGREQRKIVAKIFMCQFESGASVSIDKRFLVPIYAPVKEPARQESEVPVDSITTYVDLLEHYDYQKSKDITDFVKHSNTLTSLPAVFLLGSEIPIVSQPDEINKSLPFIDLSGLSDRQMEVLIDELVAKLETTHEAKYITNENSIVINVTTKFKPSIKHEIAANVVRILDLLRPFKDAILPTATASELSEHCF